MNSPSHSAPYTLPRYTREWVYTFLGLAAAFTIYFKVQHPLVSKPLQNQDPHLAAQECYWFFALQLPMPDPHMAPGQLYQKTFDWFSALRRGGFHPMLLSDVRARMSKGMLLPENTVVLSVDEALLTTFQAYNPLLKDLKFPAVLVTMRKPLREGDHGYLSYNAVEKLPESGLWDVILLDERAPSQLLSPQDVPIVLPIPPANSPWSSREDRSLANQLIDLRKPRRLSITWAWSGQDVVNRLQAETPIHPHGSHLSARPVLGRAYGIVLPTGNHADVHFSLAAAPDERSRDISWLGTRGLENFKIRFSIESATGQVWFLLRSAGNHGDTISVGFVDGKVMVKQQSAGAENLLAMTDWPRTFPWTGTIELRGSEAQIFKDDKSILTSRVSRRTTHRAPTLLQLMVYDQLYGAAQVKNISVEILPLLSFDFPFNEGSL